MLKQSMLATLVPIVLIGIIALIVFQTKGPMPPDQTAAILGGSKENPTERAEPHRVYASAGLIKLVNRNEPPETRADLLKMIADAGLQKSWVVEVNRLVFSDGSTRNANEIVYPGMLVYRFERDIALIRTLREPSGEVEVITIPQELEGVVPETALRSLIGED